MQICSKTFIESDDHSVKLAVRAAYTQMLNSFCLNQYLIAVIFFALFKTCFRKTKA